MSDEAETEEVKGEVYREKVPQVEALQFDGENGEDVVKFVGGDEFGKVSGKTVELSLQGKDPRSQKVVVSRGQWIVKSPSATTVVNEGEFAGKYETKEGEAVKVLEPEPEPEPVPEEELVYEPGFAKPTDEAKPEAEPAPAEQ